MAQRMAEPYTDESQEQTGGEVSTDFPTVSTPDQTDIPHHGAVDPSGPSSDQEPSES